MIVSRHAAQLSTECAISWCLEVLFAFVRPVSLSTTMAT